MPPAPDGRERRRPRPAVALAIALAFLAATNAAGWLVYLPAYRAIDEEQVERLLAVARLEADHLAQHVHPAAWNEEVGRLRDAAGLYDVFVLDPDRHVMAAARPDRRALIGEEDLILRTDLVEIRRAFEGVPTVSVPYQAEGRSIRRAYAPLRRGGTVAAVVGITAPTEAFARFERLRVYLVWLAGASIAATAALFLAYRRWGMYLRGVAVVMERQERLAAIGSMAATVAHEVRNPLGIIRATVDVIERENPLPDDALGLLADIRSEVARLDEVVTGLLDLARAPRLDLSEVDVNALVERVVMDWERARRGGGPEVRVAAAGGVGTIRADAKRLHQALLNLLLNAAEAAGEYGHVEVQTARAGGGVEITVADDGPGIPPEDRDRVFEPFFSRRPGGTGLGLAVVAAAVRAHGGTVEIRSREGHGTVLAVRLPASPPGSATIRA